MLCLIVEPAHTRVGFPPLARSYLGELVTSRRQALLADSRALRDRRGRPIMHALRRDEVAHVMIDPADESRDVRSDAGAKGR